MFKSTSGHALRRNVQLIVYPEPKILERKNKKFSLMSHCLILLTFLVILYCGSFMTLQGFDQLIKN